MHVINIRSTKVPGGGFERKCTGGLVDWILKDVHIATVRARGLVQTVAGALRHRLSQYGGKENKGGNHAWDEQYLHMSGEGGGYP